MKANYEDIIKHIEKAIDFYNNDVTDHTMAEYIAEELLNVSYLELSEESKIRDMKNYYFAID